ncbi:MAG: carbonic anhydrase, partial [Bacteroidetes bacterium]|nr:carbonic anhydrase [Bacteroidota bacterium]
QKAWKKGNKPEIHGWAYGLKDGHIHTLCSVKPDTPIDPLYQFDNL